MSGASPVRGRTIRIYLADGVSTGILTAEIMNWTGKVVVAPRTRLPDLVARPEASRTGIYFLAGPNPEDAQRTLIYVGESDNVGERLKQHNQDETKDFFSRICMVVSKDENLTKTHVRYLESRLLTLTKAANRAKPVNFTDPTFDRLPESDRADMEFFVEQIALILPVLGFDFMQAAAVPSQPSTTTGTAAPSQPMFEFATVGVQATAVEANGEFIVLKGSTARLNGTASWTSYKDQRDRLMAEGKLVEADDPTALRFAEDVAFDSPSAAAAVVYAGNQNGRMAWRVKGTGQTYRDWQESKISDAEAKS